ncbi:MAG: polyprenyl synthetase family protein [Ignavibacteriales bacterium]|nr:polyprenyl synthetase family protein [Ignavibacteriales bacterium]
MNKLLKEISLPVFNELEKFNDVFRNAIRSETKIVDLIARYILRQKSKKIRPLLVFLSSKLVGDITDKSFRAATLIEILHTATLIHDDVVDDAKTRRGFLSINAVWKNKASVLMGDYLLAKGLMIAVKNQDYDVLEAISDTVKKMSEGELLQIHKTRKLDVDEETYFKIISKKTASLFETCCSAGAMSSTNNPSHIQKLKEFGLNLGIAFQIKDDIMDYVGEKKILGKPLLADLKEKKITLPLIYSLNKVGKKDTSKIIKIIKNEKKITKVKQILDFVKENNGIEYSIEMTKKYSKKAKECLNDFPDSQIKKSFEKLIDFVVTRVS